MNKHLSLMVCHFKRTQTSAPEIGILVNDGSGPILDMNGQVVEEIWNYTQHPYEGAILLTQGEKP